MGKAIIYLADGTEECEALLCADLLRRAGAEVVLAAVGGRWEIVSSHGVAIRADALAEEADIAGTDLLVLPGGWPGTKHLEDCPAVQEAVLAFAAAGKPIAAICAAPSILGHLGLLKGRRATAAISRKPPPRLLAKVMKANRATVRSLMGEKTSGKVMPTSTNATMRTAMCFPRKASSFSKGLKGRTSLCRGWAAQRQR